MRSLGLALSGVVRLTSLIGASRGRREDYSLSKATTEERSNFVVAFAAFRAPVSAAGRRHAHPHVWQGPRISWDRNGSYGRSLAGDYSLSKATTDSEERSNFAVAFARPFTLLYRMRDGAVRIRALGKEDLTAPLPV